MTLLAAWGLVAVLSAVNYWVGSRRVRRSYAKERACPNPLHRAEAAQQAAIAQVGVVAITVWTAVVMVAVTLVPVESAGAWWAVLLVSLMLAVTGLVAIAAWKMRRARTLGLSGGVCA